MSIFVLYHRSSRPTGSVIGEALKAEHGEMNTPRRLGADQVLLRWGSRASWHVADRELNPAAAIARASDKLGSLEILRDAGIRVPDWSEDPTELEYPFLGRSIQHTRGTDIVLCLQEGDHLRSPRDYYVQYVPTKREFRVHVVDGRVIRVQGKFLDQPALGVPWVRNHKHGYRFRAPRKQINSDRRAMAIASVEALGLDFGAVDLLIGDDNETYILEVNTAPACSPLTGTKYIEAFQRLLGLKSNQVDLTKLASLSTSAEEDE